MIVITQKSTEVVDPIPSFDKKYKTIITLNCKSDYQEILHWINDNSGGSVDVKFDIGCGFGIEKLYIGFEKSDDATFFKIKYKV